VTTVAMNMMTLSSPLLLERTIATGMMTSSSPLVLCFSYFNELVKLYKCYHMEKHYILSIKLI
jgi:hypothetical protein